MRQPPRDFLTVSAVICVEAIGFGVSGAAAFFAAVPFCLQIETIIKNRSEESFGEEYESISEVM